MTGDLEECGGSLTLRLRCLIHGLVCISVPDSTKCSFRVPNEGELDLHSRPSPQSTYAAMMKADGEYDDDGSLRVQPLEASTLSAPRVDARETLAVFRLRAAEEGARG